MMQNVATAKSEVAAFATGAETNSFAGSKSNEQFGKLLQDQKSLHSSVKIEEKTAQFNNTSNQKTQKSSSSQDKTTMQSATEDTAIDNGELKDSDIKADSPLVLPLKQDDTGPELGVESANIVAQEWVSLVDNLQKLADIAQLNKTPLVDAASLDLANKVEKGLLQQIPDSQMVDNPNMATDEISELQLEDNNVAVNLGTDDGQLLAAKEKAALLANQKVETNAAVDLTLAVNKALLSTLTDEPDVQLDQVALGNIPNTNKTQKVTSNSDVRNILNLTDNKLDKVLENIAQRVFDSKKTAEPMDPEQIAQQVIVPKAAEIISSVESSSKDFISTLKSGLEEFKNQLSKGVEPGIDLKALVSDALAKTSDTGESAKLPVNVDQIVKSVSQVLELAQTMGRSIEHHHDQVYSTTSRDIAQIQGEQSKQIQLNQSESKFEKAINIAKPDGQQQLAEKVRWMVNTKNLVAEIRLDPADLGSVHVKVAVSGESASVNFVVQSQQARDAMDSATPKLREMLAEKGIELGQSSVRQESDEQKGQGESESGSDMDSGHDETEDVEVPDQVLAQQNIVNGSIGGIDYFV